MVDQLTKNIEFSAFSDKDIGTLFYDSKL